MVRGHDEALRAARGIAQDVAALGMEARETMSEVRLSGCQVCGGQPVAVIPTLVRGYLVESRCEAHFLAAMDALKARERRICQIVRAAAAVHDWLRSEAGPLYASWENGNLAHWLWIDGGAWTWEQTLWNIENTQTDLRTEPVPSTAVDVYRALHAALDALPAAERARWGVG